MMFRKKPKKNLKVKRSDKSLSISHDYAKVQEQKTAIKFGGRQTSGSGSGMTKGDVRVKGKYRIECKCTKNKSYALNYDYLEKFYEQAVSLGEIPFMELHFINDLGIKKRGYIIIPEECLEDLTNGR